MLEVIADNVENIHQKKARLERMDKYTRDLIAYAKREMTRLEIPECITPCPQKKINAEIERIKTTPTRVDRFEEFFNFLLIDCFSENLKDLLLSYKMIQDGLPVLQVLISYYQRFEIETP